jgi:hypothetical protein
MAADLLLEIEDGEGSDPEPIAAPAKVMRLSAFNDVLGDLPMISIDPFDMASPAQGFQTTDMRADEGFGVLTLPLKAVADASQVLARPVDTAVFRRIGGDVAVGRPWTRDDWSGFNNHVPSHLFDPARVLELDVMDFAIDAVDDQMDPLAQLVVPRKAFGQDPAHNLFPGTLPMKGVLANSALLGKAVGNECAVNGIDDLIALAKPRQDWLGPIGDDPLSWLGLSGKTVSFQVLYPTDHQVAVFAHEPGRLFPRPQVDHRLLPLLAQEHLVEPGQALGLDLVLQLGLQFDFALVTKFPSDQFACPVADAMGDVVAGDVEDAAVIEDAADDDVGVGMAGVVMVDRDPVEAGRQIQFHLAHEVAGEAAKVRHFSGIFRRYDEAKLMAIFPAALHKGLAIGLVLEGGIGLAPFSIPRNPVPFEVTEMGVYRLHCRTHLRRLGAPPLRIEPNHPCLDHHTTSAETARGIPLPASVSTLSGKRSDDLRAAATCVEPPRASSFPGIPRSPLRTYAAGIASRLADRNLDLLEERLGARIDARSMAAGPPRPDPKIFALVPRHGEMIDIDMSPHKRCPASIASNRVNAQGGEQTASTLMHAHCGSHRLKI